MRRAYMDACLLIYMVDRPPQHDSCFRKLIRKILGCQLSADHLTV